MIPLQNKIFNDICLYVIYAILVGTQHILQTGGGNGAIYPLSMLSGNFFNENVIAIDVEKHMFPLLIGAFYYFLYNATWESGNNGYISNFVYSVGIIVMAISPVIDDEKTPTIFTNNKTALILHSLAMAMVFGTIIVNAVKDWPYKTGKGLYISASLLGIFVCVIVTAVIISLVGVKFDKAPPLWFQNILFVVEAICLVTICSIQTFTEHLQSQKAIKEGQEPEHQHHHQLLELTQFD